MNIKKVSYEDILPLWKKLWPNSTIHKQSSMMYLGGNDTRIYDLYNPSYFGLVINNNIIGCMSGHRSTREYYRIRGLYLLEEYRGKKLSKYLFDKSEEQALQENCNFIWSYPKHSAIHAYEKAGYEQTSSWLVHDITHESNCYVGKKL
jgi:GNAT superfamily N-acetyltransferase